MTRNPFGPRPLRKVANNCVAILCCALLARGEVMRSAQEQAPATSVQQETAKIPPDQLDSLVAPIALYPDPMLAQVLAASTYPLEIMQLQQWLTKNKGLKDKALVDAVSKQPWDPSVQGLAALPDVVKRLADDIQWTTDLGNAFLAQQSDVMDAVQRMRKKAKDAGNLKSTEQQKVETKVVESKQVVVIEQSNPQVVYVPSYNPVVVYGPPVYPYPPITYPPPGYYAAGMAISFGVGLAMGAAWGGGWGYNAGWGHNDVNVNVNNNFNRNTNVNGGNRVSTQPARGSGGNGWQHNPQHRGGLHIQIGPQRINMEGRLEGPRYQTARRMHAGIRPRRETGPKQVGVGTKVKAEGSRARVIEVQAVRGIEVETAPQRAEGIEVETAPQRAGEIAVATAADPPAPGRVAKAPLWVAVQAAGAAVQQKPAAREGAQAWAVAAAALAVVAVVGGGGNQVMNEGRQMNLRKSCVLSRAALRGCSKLALACAFTLLYQPCLVGQEKSPVPATQTQQTFKSPNEAAEALIQAARSNDVAALLQIFGSDGEDLVASEDAVQDKNIASAFATEAQQKITIAIDPKKSDRAILVVGDRDWPMPIPIVKRNGLWVFDTKAGRQEMLYRRIGANELDALQICRNYVEAQQEYALTKHDGSEVNQYAQRILSTQGKEDGLAWRNADGSLGGPIAEGTANALEEGYSDRAKPYHGYFFKILKGQGPAAPLGKMDFVVEGAMIGGFALAAAPADYRVTGVKTFIVSYEGVVYQKDLGPDTLKIFKEMQLYNPDKSWTPTYDGWPEGAQDTAVSQAN